MIVLFSNLRTYNPLPLTPYILRLGKLASLFEEMRFRRKNFFLNCLFFSFDHTLYSLFKKMIVLFFIYIMYLSNKKNFFFASPYTLLLPRPFFRKTHATFRNFSKICSFFFIYMMYLPSFQTLLFSLFLLLFNYLLFSFLKKMKNYNAAGSLQRKRSETTTSSEHINKKKKTSESEEAVEGIYFI